MYQLLEGSLPSSPTVLNKQKKNVKQRIRKKKSTSPLSTQPTAWTQEHQKVLETLLDCLTSPPVLAFPYFKLPEKSPDPGYIDQQELRVAQQDDPAVGPVKRWKLSGRKPGAAEKQKELHETNALTFDRKKLEVNKGIHLRKTGARSQIVLPRKYRPVVYQELHQKLSHVGAERGERSTFLATYETGH